MVQLLISHGPKLDLRRHLFSIRKNPEGIAMMPLLLLLCKNSSVDISKMERIHLGERLAHGESQQLGVWLGEIEGDIQESACTTLEEQEGCEPGGRDDVHDNNMLSLMRTKQFEAAAAAIEYGVKCSSLSLYDRGFLCLISASHDLRRGMNALIMSGAPKDFVTSLGGWTALHRAAFHGYLDLVRILCDGGWSVCMEDKVGYTPMHIAAEQGHLEVFEELLGAVDMQQITADKSTALHLAAENGHIGIVNRLLDRKSVV